MRSYQGPSPTRSAAFTPVVVLRKARQTLADEPAMAECPEGQTCDETLWVCEWSAGRRLG